MATLVTGAPTHVHGIYGYKELAHPREKRSVLEVESGFDARRLRAEPLWTTAARAGRSVALAFAPLARPMSAYAAGGSFGPSAPGEVPVLTVDGYGAVLAGQAAYRARDLAPGPAPPPPPSLPAMAETRGLTLVFPETASDLAGLALLLGLGRAQGSDRFGHAWVQAPGAPSVPLPLGEPVHVRLLEGVGAVLLLFALDPDGRDLLLWRGAVYRVKSSPRSVAADLVRAVGPFLGSAAGHAYREGLLGATCRDGGDGTAERRYLASLAASSRQFAAAGCHILRAHPSDVTVLYEPCIDETAHLVQDLAQDAIGEPATGAAARGLDLLREAYRLADRHLGDVLALAGDDAIVAVGSDHGQEASRWRFRPNVLLREAGLLGTDENGAIDLARTQVLYGVAANGYVVVNADDRPRGIVPRARVLEVATAARDVLLAARGRKGEPLILAAHFPGEVTARGRVPDDDAGDLFLMAAPGVGLGLSATGEVLEPSTGGHHTQAHDALELDALFVVAGPGAPARGRLEERVENLDVAPTLAGLLGLPRPRDATGRDLFARGG
jgi:hypothetical protein